MSAKDQRNRPRLGRGLSSLLSVSDTPLEVETALPKPVNRDSNIELPQPPSLPNPQEVELSLITPNPHQPRRTMNEASIVELAASLTTTGLIQPIIVRKVEGGYQLIAGERRWRAAKYAKFETIPVIVREVDAFSQAQMALIENTQREDLNPIDRAQSYRSLIDKLGLTQAELAARLGEDRSTIANHLRLLDLAITVREQVQSGALSLGHAKLLAGVSDASEQQRLADLVKSQDLSVRNLERLIQGQIPARKNERTTQPVLAHLADLEKSISRQLGMRVNVRSNSMGTKGRLTVHYASLDHFDDLMRRMGVRVDE